MEIHFPEKAIHEIWLEKSLKPETVEMSLEDFLYVKLRNQFGIQSRITHWAYNFVESLERYRYDADCEIFLEILNGNLPLGAYEEQQRVVNNTLEAMTQFDIEKNGKKKDKLSRELMFQFVEQHFHTKREKDLMALKRAIFNDQSSKRVSYLKLFKEDTFGNQSHFVEAIRDQFVFELIEFRDDVRTELTRISVSVLISFYYF